MPSSHLQRSRGPGPRARRPRRFVSRLRQVGSLGQLHPEIGLDEAVNTAVEDRARVADLVAGPEVLDDLVRLEYVRTDLVAEADVAFLVVLLGILGLALLFLHANHLGL